MTDYTITTDFGAKDSLPSGNAAKVIKGSEFTAEFTNIKTAVNSKADSVSPTFTGDTALNGTTTFGPDGTSTFNGTVNFTKDVTFDTDTMFVDVSENKVGIGTTSPATALDVTGTVTASGLTVDTDTLHVDATNDRVGIGTASPANTLTVGNLEASSIYADATVGIKCDTNHKGLILQENSGAEQWSMGVNANGDLNFYDSAVTDPLVTFQDNSGNVGIGTTSPNTSLHVKNGDFRVEHTRPRIYLTDTNNNSDYSIINNNGDFSIYDDTNAAYRMYIDSSGNLLVGKTSASINTAGAQLNADGLLVATRDGGNTAVFNRKTSDGNVVQFRKDNTTVGSIGTIGGEIYIESGDVGLQFDASGNDIIPYGGGFRDATIDLGSSANRFKDLYLSGGVYLGGTGSANKLDDYEEGSWTMSLRDSESTPNVSSTTNTGCRYVKVGDMVTVVGQLVDINKGSLSSNLKITGLPFTIKAGSTRPHGSLQINNFTSGMVEKGVFAQGQTGSNYCYIKANQNGTGAGNLTGNTLAAGNSSDIFFSITYIAQ
jgi:hypothetical protein